MPNPLSLRGERIDISPVEIPVSESNTIKTSSIEDRAVELNAELDQTEATFIQAGKAALSLYKLLGETLTQIKSTKQHGEWGKWLKSRSINERRDRRARQIFTSWERLEAISDSVTDLTLTDALDLLKKPLPEVEETEQSLSFESVREEFAPWGSFERTDSNRFKYVLNRPGGAHFFRGLNEASKWREEHCHDGNRLEVIKPVTGELRTSPFVPEIVSRAESILKESALKIGDRATVNDRECVVTETLETGDIGLTALDGSADQIYVKAFGTPTSAAEVADRLPTPETPSIRERMTSSKTDEHYTPPELLELVYECFAPLGVDLDPCSNAHGEEANVKASQYFTIEDDGLAQEWNARTVYINPPYSDVAAWVDKVVTEQDQNNIGDVLLLVKADTSTQWFAQIWESATAVCFLKKRVRFINSDSEGNAAPFASAIAYFGSEIDRFYYTFESAGSVVQLLNPEMFGS
jgi:phage N-6-adenine-methyltransferase